MTPQSLGKILPWWSSASFQIYRTDKSRSACGWLVFMWSKSRPETQENLK